ncbi:MAG: YsnF/AvaK domain-containing protein [Acetobacteraceae bacterium]|nr:YsnF/AvaK domain-containing protein [Acetobacteraceae bacterium]
MSDKTSLPPRPADDVTVIPLAEETASITKRVAETGRVRVSVVADQVPALLRETLHSRRVEVERVAVGRVLAEGEPPPASREEGNTLVIPILEETAVVVKRLVLREEVRLRFLTEEAPFEEQVSLRRETAVVERLSPSPSSASPDPDPDPARGPSP